PGRVTSLIYERAGGMFNFVGLRAFKEKWSPRWEPRYLAYASDADLPKVAVAVMRAGELRDPRKPTSKIMQALLRYPFTVAMFGLQLWISVVTMSHPEVHTQLMHHFGMAWQDVSHLQLWRLITSPLIPPSTGFVWINLFLIALGLPWAERRLGTRWALLVFFGGDLLSTIPVLIGTRIAAAAGSSAAAEHVFRHDSGLSAGAWSLFAAVAWSLPRGMLRRGGMAIVLAILLFMIAFDRHLFDIQHLVSACGVLAIFATIEALGRRRARGMIAPTASTQPDSG
ncbi:MAG TPA: phosphatidylglycerol lysyltransferase domain-containing protein, partial [Mycobacteriales bacterium]|nr:phosphatidylglycerol lysyltransferase domain-containing protein [Mycobacteriales bacterium]